MAQNIKKQQQSQKTPPKAYKFIALLFPFLILLFIELILRIFSVGDNLNLFIDNPQENYSEYKIVNPIAGKKYFQKLEYTAPRNDIFLKKKTDNTFRVMVMGSSTVYGFPYAENLMYSRILHQMLEDAYPDKNIEVVNTAITAINSYTLADYIDQILDEEPDAILIYAGHNEFYGAFGIGSNETMSQNKTVLRLHLKLMDLKLYQVIRKGITSIAQNSAKKKAADNKGTLMKRIVKDKDILYKSNEYNTAIAYYEDNMTYIVKKATKKNVPVFLSEIVSNVRDLKPFNSLTNENTDSALDVYKKAQTALLDSNYALAKELFTKAKDLDAIRFRASSDINKIINNIAEDEKVHLIPMQSYFDNEAMFGIVGNDLMTEHVHPNAKGYFVMANAYFESIFSADLLPYNANTSQLQPIGYYMRNYGFSNLDILTGYHRVELLKNSWPFTEDYLQANAYRDNYQPNSHIDSIAFGVMKYTNIKLEDEHLKLAKQYEMQQDHYKAYREYETLLRINPYLAINYKDAAKTLLALSDLPKALDYFEKAIEIEGTFFTYFKTGEIYIMKGDYKSAITYLEKAYELAPVKNRINVANKLYVAYSYAGNQSKARAIADGIKKQNPNINLSLPPKQYLYTNYIPVTIANDIALAKQHLNDNKHELAIKTLHSSLSKWYSPITVRTIGDIHIKNKNYKAAYTYYQKVYNDFKFDPQFLHNNLLLYLTHNEKANANKCLKQLKLVAPNYASLAQLEQMLSTN